MVQEHRQGAAEGILRLRPSGDLNPKPLAEERRRCPVATVRVAEDYAPVLQLGEGLQLSGAVLDCAKVRPSNARQVNDRGSFRKLDLRKHAGHARIAARWPAP